MKWINIDIKRPEIAIWVLCKCTKGSNWLAFMANGGWYIDTNYGQLFVSNADKNKKIEIAQWTQIIEPSKENDKTFTKAEVKKIVIHSARHFFSEGMKESIPYGKGGDNDGIKWFEKNYENTM